MRHACEFGVSLSVCLNSLFLHFRRGEGVESSFLCVFERCTVCVCSLIASGVQLGASCLVLVCSVLINGGRCKNRSLGESVDRKRSACQASKLKRQPLASFHIAKIRTVSSES